MLLSWPEFQFVVFGDLEKIVKKRVSVPMGKHAIRNMAFVRTKNVSRVGNRTPVT